MIGPMSARLDTLPSSLREAARWERLGPSRIPVMLAHPDWAAAHPVPAVIWMHGRTVSKEIDPGRYLRWLRAGIGVCAVDLPGHGERFEAALQAPSRTFDVVWQMQEEIDGLLEALGVAGQFDPSRMAIGGMSAGGMATLARLCRPHAFRCASVEATSGSWWHQREHAMFRGRDEAAIATVDPIRHLDTWREIPLQAFHARHDEWVSYEGQAAFIDAVGQRYADPRRIELVTYEHTGAPYEHAGFGRMAADAKNRQRDFFRRHLLPPV
jgi:alpha-beta hydrolase superfamily lysophospholipase